MLRRMYFPLVTLFWVTMNVLLWRFEMGGAEAGGSPVPVASVWARMLDAPDESSLQVFQRGEKLGFCRWTPNIDEELVPVDSPLIDNELEGRIERVTGYLLDFEGNVLVGDPAVGVRFFCHAEFETNRVWQTGSINLTARGTSLRIEADAKRETVRVTVTMPRGEPWSQEISMNQLQQPAGLLAPLAGQLGLGWLAPLSQGLGATDARPIALGIRWKAWRDWLKVGGGRLRVWRLQADFFDEYRMKITLSRVGEILRAELPDEIVLVNEALAPL